MQALRAHERVHVEQARRTLEGVEEGTPRVRVAGERTDKPW